MEKIYESQESNKKKQKRHKQMKLSGSTCLSFSVALIAVFALLAVGISGISYALPQPEEYENTVTSNVPDLTYYMGNESTLVTDPTNNVDQIIYASVTSGSTSKKIFCIDRTKDFPGVATAYTKDAEITDLGLYYILSYVDSKDATWDISTGVNIVNNSGSAGSTQYVTEDTIKYWAGQAAIYNYLGTNGGSTSQYNSANLKNYKLVTTNVNTDYFDTPVSHQDLTIETIPAKDYTDAGLVNYFTVKDAKKSLFDSIKVENKTITELISEANKKKTSGEELVSITITNTDKTIEKKNNYYISGPYTVNVNTAVTYTKDIGDIKVTLNGAPDGTKLIGGDGKEIDASKMPTSTNFYLRVPADKVTKATKITISVGSTVTYYTGYKYVASGKQTLAVLGPKTKDISTGTEVELTPAGDTGMNVGQTVYFIGLIVLLCGVGIIYANAKPAQVKE